MTRRALRLGAAACAIAALLGAAPSAPAAKPPPPRIATFRTLPATAGMTLVYRGRTYLTGADGSVTIDVSATPRPADPRLEVKVRQLAIGDGTRRRFSRWLGDVRTPIVALTTYRLVRWRFVDLGGDPVDVGRIQRLVLKSVTGEVTTYSGADLTASHWLLAQRIVPLAGGLEEKDLYYSVQRVDVLDSNVVNKSQQRFEPSSQQDLTFRLSFYPLRLQAKDAIFGRPAGHVALVQFPDGHVERVPLRDGVVQLHSLPRGSYSVTIEGGGFAFKTPVAVSKPQEAVFPVVTWLDIVVVGGSLLLVAVTLLLVGRPGLARRPLRLARRLRAALHRPRPDAASGPEDAA